MILLLTLFALQFPAPSYEAALLYLSGASCVEELSESQLEHFQQLSDSPIPLNSASRSRLLSSELFSAYQIASLLQYKSDNGAILSFSELALIDGFSEQYASALRHFVLLDNSAPPAQRPSPRLKQTATISASARVNESLQSTQRIKYSAQLEQIAQLQYSTRSTYSEPQLSFGTLSAAYYGKRGLSQLVLGNFAARFGQGLLQWSGMRLSGYSSIAAFSHNGRGLGITAAADAPLLGIGTDWQLGRFNLSTAYSFKGQIPIVNLSYHSLRLSLGATANNQGASLDWRYALKDASVYGELASSYNAEFCALAGLLWTPEYGKRFVVQARYYDAKYKQYSGLAMGLELPSLFASLDLGYSFDKQISQLKALVLYSLGFDKFGVKIRYSARLRPSDTYPWRNDLRSDLEYSFGTWSLSSRLNALWCRSFGYLAYIQLSNKAQKHQISLRVGYHNIPYWEDRIYVYQQDAPGSFNIPAFYKSGISASLFAALHLNTHHSLWLRLSYLGSYPELRLQYRLRY